MPLAISILLAVLIVASLAGLRQHFKYLSLRRDRVEDRQPLLYPAGTFHAVTFLKVEDGRPVLDEVSALRAVIESKGGGLVVYAGQAAMNMVASAQLSNDWDALVFAQYPSREAFDRFRASPDHAEVMARFADTHTHGVLRPAATNLAIPLGLLALRVANILRREPSTLPYTPVGDDAMPRLKILMKRAEELDRFRELKDDAVVIFNLIQPGNAEQRNADRSYTQQMMSGMAEGSYGPMHMGRAVALDEDARFEKFAVVYYPGIDHMQAMLGSTFMNRIGSGKQLGDSLAVATIPILSKLQARIQAPPD